MDKHKLKQEIIGILCALDFRPDDITKQIDLFYKHQKKISYNHIFRCASEACGIDSHEIFIKSRRDEIVLARFIAWSYIRSKTSLSFGAIGKFFRMDHSSVHHGINKLKYLMEINDEIAIKANIRFYNLISKK